MEKDYKVVFYRQHVPLFFFLKILFILESMSQGSGRGRRDSSMSGEPDMGLNPGPRDHDLSQRLNQLSHPGAPGACSFKCVSCGQLCWGKKNLRSKRDKVLKITAFKLNSHKVDHVYKMLIKERNLTFVQYMVYSIKITCNYNSTQRLLFSLFL